MDSSVTRYADVQSGLRVFLVEDDPADAAILSRMLKRSFGKAHVLRVASNLADAVRGLSEEGKAYDVILLDIGLPDTTDLSGLERLREMKIASPIIVLTGADDDSLALRAVAKDAQDYLVKWEFDENFISRSIRHAIERHQLVLQLTLAKDEAELANRAKSDFLANMSHEIRTPMNTVLGMAELLHNAKLSPTEREQLHRLQRAGDHLMSLLEDILDLSRIEAGQMHLEETSLDLDDLVRTAIDIPRLAAERKGVSLLVERDAVLPQRINGDPKRLRQILLNLVNNAVKFTDKGFVRISILPDDGGLSLHFTVEDSGAGIPNDKLDAIFGKFVQAETSTARRFGGSGLGLPIARRLTESMNGRLYVESTVGKGSTFHVVLPLRSAEDQHERDGVDQDVPALETKLRELERTIRILMIDDSPDNHELAKAFVADLPVAISTAESCEEGRKAFGRETYDLVIVDMHMPTADGVTTLRALRQIEKENFAVPTPMIAFSADVLKETIARAMGAGADGYLSKPLRRKTFLENIALHTATHSSVHAFAKPAPLASDLRAHALGAASAPSTTTDFGEATKPEVRKKKEGIDPRILPILPPFLENRKNDLGLIEGEVCKGDFDAVYQIAHRMKGTGASYGFPKISEIGEALEVGATAKDAEAIRLQIQELATELARIDTIVGPMLAAATAQVPSNKQPRTNASSSTNTQPSAVLSAAASALDAERRQSS